VIKAAILDFNGVVIENNDFQTFQAAARARGVPLSLFFFRYCLHNCAHLTGKMDSFSFWSRVLDNGRAPLTRGEFEKLLTAPYKANKPFYGVLDAVAGLRRNGVKCVLLTNTSDYQVATNRMLKRYAGFDALVFSNEIKAMKPFPAAFEAALKAVGARADETLFVDDSWYNVLAATLLGFQVVYFHSPEQLKADLKRVCGHKEG